MSPGRTQRAARGRRLPLLGRLPIPGALSWGRRPRLGSGRERQARLFLARHRRPLAFWLALLALWTTIRSAAPSPPATIAVLVAAHDLPAGRTVTSADLRATSWPANAVPSGLLSPARAGSATGRVLATAIRAGEPVTDARVVGPGLLAGQPPGTVAVPVRLSDASATTFVRAGDRVDVLVSTSSSDWASSADPGSDSTGPLSAAGSPTPAGSSAKSGVGSAVEAGSGSGSGSGAGVGAVRVTSSALVLAAGPSAEAGQSADATSGSGLAGLGSTGAGESSGAGESGTGQTAAGVIVLAVSPADAARLAAAQTGNFVTIAVLPRS